MIKTLEVVRRTSLISEISKPDEPKGARIVLSVCSCYRQDKLTLITEKALKVAQLLGVSVSQLECFAITAMFTGKPEIVACYNQQDVAETKLEQLQVETPFISRPCHSFELFIEK